MVCLSVYLPFLVLSFIVLSMLTIYCFILAAKPTSLVVDEAAVSKSGNDSNLTKVSVI